MPDSEAPLSRCGPQHQPEFIQDGRVAAAFERTGSAVASGTGAVLVPAAGILRSLPARLGSETPSHGLQLPRKRLMSAHSVAASESSVLPPI
jgi:hypothetical protein